MAKMFEEKKDSHRKSAHDRSVLKNEINTTEDSVEESYIDDIFDDIVMPDLERKRSGSILEKVELFNKADIVDTQKIIHNVAISNVYVDKPKWIEGGTFEEEVGTARKRKKSNFDDEMVIHVEQK